MLNKTVINQKQSKTATNMKDQSFTTTILVDQSPEEVFKAINNPCTWWSEDIAGNPDKLNEEWTYHFGGWPNRLGIYKGTGPKRKERIENGYGFISPYRSFPKKID